MTLDRDSPSECNRGRFSHRAAERLSRLNDKRKEGREGNSEEVATFGSGSLEPPRLVRVRVHVGVRDKHLAEMRSRDGAHDGKALSPNVADVEAYCQLEMRLRSSWRRHRSRRKQLMGRGRQKRPSIEFEKTGCSAWQADGYQANVQLSAMASWSVSKVSVRVL